MTDARTGLLCLPCGAVVSRGDAAGLRACPACGLRTVPADLADTRSVRLTWHELTVLVMWAERWAHANRNEDPTLSRIVYGIADRLQEQHLDRPGLTFAGEAATLREAHPDAEIDPRLPGGDEPAP